MSYTLVQNDRSMDRLSHAEAYVTKQLKIAGLALGLGLVLVVTAATTACTRVDSYEVAVKKNAITGAVADNIYSQGLYHAIFRDWTT